MPSGNSPNIIVVVMDCVRAQNLPIYGYEKQTAPRISELAGEAVRFDHAITAGDQTLSSTASLFTGSYPSSHHLRISGETLDPGVRTLAEAMKQGGYETHCINCNNPYVSPFSQLHRGFDTYTCAFPALRRWIAKKSGRRGGANLMTTEPSETETPSEPERDRARPPRDRNHSDNSQRKAMASRIRWMLTWFTDRGGSVAFKNARNILERSDPARPVFLYIHLMETHCHYLPPWRHRKLFLPDCRGRTLSRINHHPLPLFTGAVKMDDLDFRIVEGLYNGAIHYTDRLFGDFYQWLKQSGKLDNTVLVLTGDHGENLGDHGMLGHGQCVYDTVVRVPLLVWGPPVEGRVRGSALPHVVQNIDLTASCLEWAGSNDDPIKSQLDGFPLPLRPIDDPPRKFAISETVRVFDRSQSQMLKERDLFRDGAIAVRSRTHKLIWNTNGRRELYDVADDPGESKNLIDRETDVLKELHRELDPIVPRFQNSHDAALERLEFGDSTDTDPVIEQRLRDLGYIE